MSSKRVSSKLSKKSCQALTLIISGLLVLSALFLLNKYVFKINENFYQASPTMMQNPTTSLQNSSPQPTLSRDYYANQILQERPCSAIDESVANINYDTMMRAEGDFENVFQTILDKNAMRCQIEQEMREQEEQSQIQEQGQNENISQEEQSQIREQGQNENKSHVLFNNGNFERLNCAMNPDNESQYLCYITPRN